MATLDVVLNCQLLEMFWLCNGGPEGGPAVGPKSGREDFTSPPHPQSRRRFESRHVMFDLRFIYNSPIRSPPRSLLNRTHRVSHYKARNLSSKGIPVQARGAIVDASKHSGIIHFQDGPRETREGAPPQVFLAQTTIELVYLVDEFNSTYAHGQDPKDAQGDLIAPIILPSKFEFGDSFLTQDVRLSRDFSLHDRWRMNLIGEVFNLFNIPNLSGRSGDLFDAGFGRATSRVSQVFGSGGPRAFRIAGRVSF